ncbi:MAG: hypothetical protein ACJASV_000503 [Pseudorhodobacter sp.]|jgi:hypothetical protein
MLRIGKECDRQSLFDDLLAIYHQDAVGDPGYYAQIMGDPNNHDTQFRAQIFNQLNNLRLNGHIKRCCRFVRDQNLGVAGQSDGDHRPLPHAARKLMRVSVQPSPCIGNVHQLWQFNRAGLGLAFIHPHIAQQRFHQVIADSVHRVQTGHRVLKHKADPPPANITQSITSPPVLLPTGWAIGRSKTSWSRIYQTRFP